METLLVALPIYHEHLDIKEIKTKLDLMGENFNLMMQKCIDLIQTDWDELETLEKITIFEQLPNESIKEYIDACLLLLPLIENIIGYFKMIIEHLGDLSQYEIKLIRSSEYGVLLALKRR